MELSPGIAGGIAAAVLVPIIFFVLGKTRTLKVHLPSDFNLEEEKKKWATFDLKYNLFSFVMMIVCVVFLYYILRFISLLLLPESDIGRVVLLPPNFIWMLPAFFGGILLAYLPCWYYLKKKLVKDDYDRYILYQNARYKVDIVKLSYIIISIFIPAVLAMIIGFMNTHAIFSKKSITLNSIMELKERTYSYNEIDLIKRIDSFKAPNGNIMRKPYHEIHFKDGYMWSFHKELVKPKGCTEKDLIDLVRNIAKLDIEVVDPF